MITIHDLTTAQVNGQTDALNERHLTVAGIGILREIENARGADLTRADLRRIIATAEEQLAR